MADPNEIGALQASFRGALAAAEALGALRERVEALGRAEEIEPQTLDEVRRLAAAHATAASALRGLVETILRRREAS